MVNIGAGSVADFEGTQEMNDDGTLNSRKAREARDFEAHTIELVMCALELAYQQQGLEGFNAELTALYQVVQSVTKNPEQRVAAMRHYIASLSPDIVKRLEQSGQFMQLSGVSAEEANALLARPDTLERRVAMLMELPDDATRH